MLFFFIDDAVQRKPLRPYMGSIVAVGGVIVKYDKVKLLENQLKILCEETGFKPMDIFKWSPSKDHWMRDNLVDDVRRDFFISVLNVLSDYEVKAIVVLEDANCKPATSYYRSSEEDVICLFLERVQKYLKRLRSDGIIISDRPGGDRTDEDSFLLNALDSIQVGTKYVDMENIALNILSTPSKFIRLLQAADLVTSCTTAYVCGMERYAASVFEYIKPLFDKYQERIGGIGLKLHPDLKYVNLYHWLLEDKIYYKGWHGIPLPNNGFPYEDDPFEY